MLFIVVKLTLFRSQFSKLFRVLGHIFNFSSCLIFVHSMSHFFSFVGYRTIKMRFLVCSRMKIKSRVHPRWQF